MGRIVCVASCLLLLVFACAPVADATQLTPGTSGVPSQIFLDPAGFTVPETAGISYPFDPATICSGQCTDLFGSFVFTDLNNPFCAGCLDFVYSVTVGPSSTSSLINRITINNFGGVSTDVGILLNSGLIYSFSNNTVPPGMTCCTQPSTVDRSSDGKAIGFNFSFDPIAPGSFSAPLVIRTNVTDFGIAPIQLIGGDGSVQNTLGYAPGSAQGVPEPSSLLLLGFGLAGVITVKFKGVPRRIL